MLVQCLKSHVEIRNITTALETSAETELKDRAHVHACGSGGALGSSRVEASSTSMHRGA